MTRNLVFLIPDGMGDSPLPELDGRTPLEAARTPNMDRLASEATLGRCRTIPPEQPPGSDIANMALLGFDPDEHHTGRGPIEAASQGLEVADEDLIYRINLCRVSAFAPEGIMEDHSGGHVDTDLARSFLDRLSRELDEEELELAPGFQYRHLLVQRGGIARPEAGLTIRPPHDILGRELGPDLEQYAKSPLLNGLVHTAARMLQSDGELGANAAWPWGQGPPLKLPSFRETFGLFGAVISAVDLIKGLGRSAGLELLHVPGATGGPDTDYRGKAEAAREFLQRGDFLYLHLEGPDECSHAGSIEDKIRCIEHFDELIVGDLLEWMRERDICCMIACDHLTPIPLRTHAPDPVPFLFHDPSAHAEGPERFSEAEAEKSGIFLEQGTELLPWILKRMEGKV
ncbi:MAG: 2,3-bisphosphoglycerate-independent phosphoglycerate mutase [Desulfohalobiaceae bacterium]